MAKFWFEQEWNQEGEEKGRRRLNRLQRAVQDSREQETGLIDHWLDLAKRLFDKDDDPDPQAA